jgi:hypothetical protein
MAHISEATVKIGGGALFARSFAEVFRHFGRFLSTAAAPAVAMIVLIALTTYLVNSFVHTRDQVDALVPSARFEYLLWLWGALSLPIYAAFSVRWQYLVLFGRPLAWRSAEFLSGWLEFSGYGYLLYVVYLVTVLLTAAFGVVLGRLTHSLLLEAVVRLAALLWALGWVISRALVFPAVASGSPVAWEDAKHFALGNRASLLGACLGAIAVFAALWVVSTIAVSPLLMPVQRANYMLAFQLAMIVCELIVQLVGFLFAGVFGAALAITYRTVAAKTRELSGRATSIG